MSDKDPLAFPPDTHNPDEMDLGRQERKEVEKRNKRRHQRNVNDLKKVLEMVEGRRVIANILYKCCIMSDNGDYLEDVFDSNAMKLSFTMGCIKIGKGILNDMRHANSNALQQIQRERESDLISEGKES